MTTSLSFSIGELKPYINWLYFFFSWQFPAKYGSIAYIRHDEGSHAQWAAHFPAEEQPRAREALKLYVDAWDMLELFQSHYDTRARFGLFEANSDGDDILVNRQGKDFLLPMLRQQHPAGPQKPNLSLADFIRPKSSREKDFLGVFATTVDAGMEILYSGDAYRKLLAQTLCDRLAEATAELLHAKVRKEIWGYAPEENLTPQDMFRVKYQGIRPAVGYPSLPDQSINFLLDDLIDFGSIGIHLTESAAMQPHGSVSGLMFAHPAAVYFAIGKIGKDQFRDYARRRNLPTTTVSRFLAANL